MGEELQILQPNISRRNFLGTTTRLAGAGAAAYALLQAEPAYAAVQAVGGLRERREQANPKNAPYPDTPATTFDVSQEQPGAILDTPTPDATVAALQKRLLQDQVKQLEAPQPPPTNWLEIAAPLIGSLGTVAAIIAGIWQFNRNREIDRQKQDEDRFQKVLENLASDTTEVKIGAAAFLWRVFLDPEQKNSYQRYYEQIFNLAVTHLRLRKVSEDDPNPKPDQFYTEIIKVFLYSVPLIIEKLEKRHINLKPQASLKKLATAMDAMDMFKPIEYRHRFLDASGVNLAHAFLIYEDYYFIQETDLRYLNLRGANLSKAILTRANLRYADLYGADLSGANLKGADLTRTNPESAKSLSQAHMNGVKGLADQQKFKCRRMHAVLPET